MGAGSYANDELPSVALQLSAPDRAKAGALHRELRSARPAVLARIDDEQVSLDLRAVAVEELEELGSALTRALESMPGGGAAAAKEDN